MKEYLHDVLINGYLNAYTQGDGSGSSGSSGGETKGDDATFHVEAFDADLHAAGLAAIKLAIIKQADYIA